MPPIKKLEKFFEILDDLDDETLTIISKLSEIKKQKLYDSFHKIKSNEINFKRLILNIK
jgi:succinate dehydrogenase flavin-adding protein (antitoxin of CptAB toxin-antitoxin module)